VIRRKFHTENQKSGGDLYTSLLSGAFCPVHVHKYTCLRVWKENAMIVRKILGVTVDILLPGCVHPCVTSLHFRNINVRKRKK
jgi:hypothetical protein